MNKTTNITQIYNRINALETGAVFVAMDFVDISDKTNVNAYLAKLSENGFIRRILRGVYEKPEYNSFLGEYIAPSPDKVANALARNFGWTIIPCGDTALNLLGLSTQVPAVWAYVSDGMYKEYTYDNTIICFKKTTNKEVSKLSYKTALIVQALKAFGKDKIDDVVISRLKKILTAEEKQTMLEEAKPVTSWIYDCIKLICRS